MSKKIELGMALTSSTVVLICVVLLRFNAKDSRGGVAPSLSITINMCYCSGHGECDFGTFIDGQLDTALFRLVTCQCETGWDGRNFTLILCGFSAFT